MILQALEQYYETLLALGRIAPPGWGTARVSFGLDLAQDGSLLSLIPYREESLRGKKTVVGPRTLEMPMPVKRTAGVASNFLCDNAGYLLGIDAKGKPERAALCFAAAKQLHETVLRGADSPAARAILAFFAAWKPSQSAVHPALSGLVPELSGVNLVFCFEGEPACSDAAVRSAWQRYYDGGCGEEGEDCVCLVTGRHGPLALVHPAVKGVRDAQPAGAALVSFNAPAFESYGHAQGANAPIGKYAAFAYTTALNALIADSLHTRVIGDTTVVCWSQHGASAYQDTALTALFGPPQGMDDTLLSGILRSIARGEPVCWEQKPLDPQEHFYMLGLAPNAARLSVRFFFADTFGDFLRNIQRHYEDIAVPCSAGDRFPVLPLWKLLGETVNQNARDKSCSPQLGGEMLRAILTGGAYPATLLSGAELRIRAERTVTRGRAAIIKGYYTRFNARSGHPHCPKEVLEMSETATNIPYTLGRLFSLYEQIQQAANPGINATIRDKYFNSAAATPAMIFPLLCNLSQKHLRKLTAGQKVYYERPVGQLSALIGEAYPQRLDLPQQGSFQLGYYYQNLKRYEPKATKKEETDNG